MVRNTSCDPECEDTGPFVFTHHDLNMRNIILGDDGKIWLIDWDYSGSYPRYFEYLSMYVPARDTGVRFESSLWSYHPFVADPYFPVHAWLCGSPKPISDTWHSTPLLELHSSKLVHQL